MLIDLDHSIGNEFLLYSVVGAIENKLIYFSKL